MLVPKDLYILLSGLTAMVIVALSIPSIIKVAKAKNLYDYPDARKAHRNSIPTLGGLAIFAGLIVSVLIWTDFKTTLEIKYILAAVILIFFIGLKDDILVIAADKKLIVQLLAAFILTVLGNIRITSLHGFAGIHEIPYFVSVLLSIFVIIVVLNGMNLIDGIDGLASGVGIVTSLTFGLYFYLIGKTDYVIFISAVIGALSAFFMYNVFGNKNKIFMGDTGSLIVGLVLAVFAIKFNEYNLTAVSKYQLSAAPAVSIGILIIPLFDTFRVFILRVVNGKSPFKADKNHMHHRLLYIGMSHSRATFVIVIANLFFIGLSFILDFVGIITLVSILLATASVLSVIPVVIYKYQNKKYLQLPVIRKIPSATVSFLFEDKSDHYFDNKFEQYKEDDNKELVEENVTIS